MRASLVRRTCVAAAAAAAATVDAASELDPAALAEAVDELRRSSGTGEEAPLRAARGGGARIAPPRGPVVAAAGGGFMLDEGRAGREGDALPLGGWVRRFSGGVNVLRGMASTSGRQAPVPLSAG